MEIFVSEKENVELQLEGRATLRTMVKQSVYGQQVNYIEQEVKSLEQHDRELLEEFAKKIIDFMSENGNEFCSIRDCTSKHAPGLKYAWFNYVTFRDKINELLKKRGV